MTSLSCGAMKPWVFAALVLTAPTLGCADRLAGEDEEPSDPACATITATGYWHDGRMHVIYEEDTGTAGTACICMTVDEIQSGELDDEVNDLAFAECTRLADIYSGDFDWSDCEERYLSGIWMGSIAFARGETAWKADGLDCSEEGPAGCSISGDRSAGGLCGLVLLGLLSLRRRQRRPRSATTATGRLVTVATISARLRAARVDAVTGGSTPWRRSDTGD